MTSKRHTLELGINIGLLLLFPLLAIVTAILLPRIVAHYDFFGYFSFFLYFLGLILFIISKISVIKTGKIFSFGPKHMEKPFKIMYILGYLLMIIAFFLQILVLEIGESALGHSKFLWVPQYLAA
jgi:hypothetical protein